MNLELTCREEIFASLVFPLVLFVLMFTVYPSAD
jgi:hypothetical protein